MEFVKRVIGSLYWVCLIVLVAYAFLMKILGLMNWTDIFHLAFYVPAIAMLSVVSGQIDLLSSMQKGGIVNLKARIYDFVHWLMLIGINIGAWMIGVVTIWWFVLMLLLLSIIGWQIGVGLKNKLHISANEKITGLISAIIAIFLGLSAGYIRNVDKSPFGWGWGFEWITAVIATLIVFKWIWHDIQTISKKASDYPRSFFLKGVFCNFLIIWFWLHVMIKSDWNWLAEIGLSFNTIVGNIIYFIYYGAYEHHLKKQKENRA